MTAPAAGAAPLEIGLATVDLTVFEPGMAMLGWGQPRNTAEGVAMPLAARALVLRDAARGHKLAYVCADLCFIPLLLRRRVLALLARDAPGLGLGEHNTMLVATHTHSGPSGFSGDLLYDLSGPGFSDRVFTTLADRLAAAVREADRRRVAGRAYFHSATVPLASPILFNRSLAAYNRNADVTPVPRDRRDEAVDRAVRVLRLDDATGRPIGAVTWLVLHGTTIHGDNQRLHPDHPGVAAAALERWARERHGSEGFVAICAQGGSADVSPNYRFDRRRGVAIGRYDDDFANAALCGEVHARVASEALDAAPRDGTEVAGPLAAVVRYTRFARRWVAPEFTDGARGRTTTDARLGLGMALGTAEGPGPLWPMRRVFRALAARAAARAGDDSDAPKVPFAPVGLGRRGRWFDRIPADSAIARWMPTDAAAHYDRLARAGALGDQWAPSVLPVQLLRLGPVLIAGLPCEVSTVACRRMRATIHAAAGSEAREVVINGYANAYSSYVVTEEEYAVQHYEAACTLFGPWTLGAYRAELAALTGRLARGVAPARPDEADLGEALPPLDLRHLGTGRFVPRLRAAR